MLLSLRRLLPFASASRSEPPTASPAPRPMHPAWVVVLVSTWLATACNVPLWQEVAQLPGQGSLRGWGFALAFALIVAAGNAALLSLLASLFISLAEIIQSTKAIELELSDIEELEKGNIFTDILSGTKEK